MRTVIRADADPALGTGHVMRCLRLATALRQKGGEVSFIGDIRIPALVGKIEAADCKVIPLIAGDTALDEGGDAEAVCAAVDRLGGCDWLVVDHYRLGMAWERRLRACAPRILAIDDLGRRHDCDLLLDQNFYLAAGERYDGKLPRGTQALLGPRYALLASEFAEFAAKVRVRDGDVRRVLVFMGGVDQANATSRVLDAISMIEPVDFELVVVIGSAHPLRDEIEARCAGLAHTQCLVDIDDMAERLAGVDLAIGAGGSATWERCALGVPSLTVCVAENQREVVANAGRAGLLYAIEQADAPAELLALHLRALIGNRALRAHISREAMAQVDGKGAGRLMAAMLAPAIAMRLAGPDDCEAIHRYRNHPSIRAVSRSSGEVPLEDHRRWFAGLLNDGDRDLLVGESDGEAVGVVRLDRSQDEAEVSIYLVPDRIGGGEGGPLLLAAEAWLRRNHPQIRLLRAVVMEGNLTSIRLFERCGYVPDSRTFRKRLDA